MAKEMREMRIRTNILIQSNENLERDKTNLTNSLNDTKELLISYQNKYTETNKKMIQISNDYGELKRNNLGNEEMQKKKDDRISELNDEIDNLHQEQEDLQCKFDLQMQEFEKMKELFESNKAELTKNSANLHESFKHQHELTQDWEKGKKELAAAMSTVNDKNNEIKNLEEELQKFKDLLDKEQKDHNDMSIAKQLLDAKLIDQKKAFDDKIVGLNTLREEDKQNYQAQNKRFDELNNQFKEKNKQYNNLKYDFDELDVKYNTTVIKL